MKILFIFLLCLISGFLVFGQDESPKEIMTLLINAVDYTSNKAVFISKNFTTDDRPLKNSVLYTDKGNIRFEFVVGTNGTSRSGKITFQDTKAGEFSWVYDKGEQKTVIHDARVTRWSPFPFYREITSPQRINLGKYSLASGSYNGIPCHKISIRYPYDDATISNTSTWNITASMTPRQLRKDPTIYERNITVKEFNENKEIFRNAYYAALIVLIDKDPSRPFIYEIQAYNHVGEKVYSVRWGEVRFVEKIEQIKFTPPFGAKIIKVATSDAFGDAYIKNYGTHKRSWVEQKWNSVQRYFSSSLSGTVALCLVIITVITMMFLKIKEKRQKKK